jgi:hypothetical protein
MKMYFNKKNFSVFIFALIEKKKIVLAYILFPHFRNQNQFSLKFLTQSVTFFSANPSLLNPIYNSLS